MANKTKKQFGVAVLKADLAKSASSVMKEVREELVKEEQDSFKDFLKAAYRLSLEKQKEVEKLQQDVAKINTILKEAEKGNWKALEGLKVPARFFKDEVLRKHGKSLISGSDEIRVMDLYGPRDED
jgi:ribosomal protein L29